MAVHI